MVKDYDADFFHHLCDSVRQADGPAAGGFGRFPYISAGNKQAETSFYTAKCILDAYKGRNITHTFLDAGCGVGVKVWIAESLGFDAKGVELCEDSVKIARMALGKRKIIRKDLLRYEGFHNYDVIYLYLPMCNPKLQKQFEENLVNRSKDDVIIISAGDHMLSKAMKWINYTPNSAALVARILKSIQVTHPGHGFNMYVKEKFYDELEARFPPCPTCKV
jgi:SAM-dependent methyltransferase